MYKEKIEDFIESSKEFTDQQKLDYATAVLTVANKLDSYKDFKKLGHHEKGIIDYIASETFLSKSTIGDIITGRGKTNGKLISDEAFEAIFRWEELQTYIFNNYKNGIYDTIYEEFSILVLRKELRDKLKQINTQTQTKLRELSKQQTNRISTENMLFLVFSDWFFKTKEPLKFHSILSNEELFTSISENIPAIKNSLELVDVNDIDKKLDFIARIDSTDSWKEVNEILNQKEQERLAQIAKQHSPKNEHHTN